MKYRVLSDMKVIFERHGVVRLMQPLTEERAIKGLYFKYDGIIFS